MSDWKHELTRDQYDAVVTCLTKASTLATVMQEMGDDVEADARSAMLISLKALIWESITVGEFSLDDVKTAGNVYLKSLEL